MVIKLQVFTIKKLDSNHTCLALISLDTLKRDAALLVSIFKILMNLTKNKLELGHFFKK